LSTSRIHSDAIGCRKLILLMIEQALEDIKVRRSSTSYLMDWHHAYKWIISDSFAYWCEMIDWDYKTIRKQVKKEVDRI